MQPIFKAVGCHYPVSPCGILRSSSRRVALQPRCNLAVSFLPTSLQALSPHLSSFHLLLKPHATHQAFRHASNIVLGSAAGDPLEVEMAKRELVSKRLEWTARYLRRLGIFGFMGQLVCSVVSAVILAFSVAISGTPASQTTYYTTAGGIAAAFLSVYWSFGYIRLSERLRSTVNDLRKAPPRAVVIKNLQDGVLINTLGMGLTLLGMLATIGTLVAKSLTTPASTYMQGTPASYSPVLALDVFLVQASASTILSHLLGLIFSIELLRSITWSQLPPDYVFPR